MKQLTKEQLEELAYKITVKVAEDNLDNMTKHVLDSIKDVSDFNIAIVNAMAVYGAEIEKECSRVIADVLYDMFYAE
ncbi:MAG: hypothetical protein HFI20_03670 [Lachnospiraceae bacterium]|nr:hypothetical protein [Lachnospiraceae bacterium]